MTQTTSRPSRADVKARILEAAVTAFLEKGYAASTVADIAARAGFTKGAVYSNFGGKPELFSAVLEDRVAGIAGPALADSVALTARRPAGTSLASIAASLTREITDDPAWPSALAEFRALAVTDPSIQTAYGKLRASQIAALSDRLRSQADALGFPEDFDYEVAANLLLTVAHSLALEHAAAPHVMTMPLVEASLTHLLDSLRR